MRGSSLLRGLAVVAFVLGVAGHASAQGFGVYEQSPCQMGRGGAGVASPCPDASSVYFNPAGLSFTETQMGLGASVIGPRGDFTDDSTGQVSTLNSKWYPLPNVYASTPIGGRFAVGVGVFAPYGLTTDWPVTSQGRFLGYKSLVQGLYIQPTAAVKVTDKISFGAGIDIVNLNVQLRQRVDLSTQPLPAIPGLPSGATFALLGVRPGSDFADINLEGDSWSVGAHFGVLVRASEKFSVGARFLTGQTVEINDGTIDTTQIETPYVLPFNTPIAPKGTDLDLLLASRFAPGQVLSDQAAKSRIPLPAQFVAGFAVQATPALRLLADYQFVDWSAFDALPINGDYLKSVIKENYKDTHGVRAGVEYTIHKTTVVRGGVDFHTAAAPDESVTPNLPEGVRQEYSAGIGQQLSPHFRVDAFYLYLHQPERAGRTNPTTNNGVYNFHANLFGVSFGIAFSVVAVSSTARFVSAPGLPAPVGPYSPALILDRLVFVSGQGAVDPATGRMAGPEVAAQTEQVFRNIRAILEAAGTDLAHVLRCGVFLVDMRDFAAMNEVYARVFGTHRPARTTVQVAALPHPDLRVEIDAVAYLP